MKYIKEYKIFETVTLKLDEILDKIGNSGLDSLSNDEKIFLNSFKGNKQEEVYKDQNRRVYEEGYFRFDVENINNDGEKIIISGILTIAGNKEFNGSLIRFNNGMNDMKFDLPDNETIFDHTEGLEYEFDNFVSSVLDQEEV